MQNVNEKYDLEQFENEFQSKIKEEDTKVDQVHHEFLKPLFALFKDEQNVQLQQQILYTIYHIDQKNKTHNSLFDLQLKSVWLFNQNFDSTLLLHFQKYSITYLHLINQNQILKESKNVNLTLDQVQYSHKLIKNPQQDDNQMQMYVFNFVQNQQIQYDNNFVDLNNQDEPQIYNFTNNNLDLKQSLSINSEFDERHNSNSTPENEENNKSSPMVKSKQNTSQNNQYNIKDDFGSSISSADSKIDNIFSSNSQSHPHTITQDMIKARFANNNNPAEIDFKKDFDSISGSSYSFKTNMTKIIMETTDDVQNCNLLDGNDSDDDQWVHQLFRFQSINDRRDTDNSNIEGEIEDTQENNNIEVSNPSNLSMNFKNKLKNVAKELMIDINQIKQLILKITTSIENEISKSSTIKKFDKTKINLKLKFVKKLSLQFQLNWLHYYEKEIQEFVEKENLYKNSPSQEEIIQSISHSFFLFAYLYAWRLQNINIFRQSDILCQTDEKFNFIDIFQQNEMFSQECLFFSKNKKEMLDVFKHLKLLLLLYQNGKTVLLRKLKLQDMSSSNKQDENSILHYSNSNIITNDNNSNEIKPSSPFSFPYNKLFLAQSGNYRFDQQSFQLKTIIIFMTDEICLQYPDEKKEVIFHQISLQTSLQPEKIFQEGVLNFILANLIRFNLYYKRDTDQDSMIAFFWDKRHGLTKNFLDKIKLPNLFNIVFKKREFEDEEWTKIYSHTSQYFFILKYLMDNQDCNAANIKEFLMSDKPADIVDLYKNDLRIIEEVQQNKITLKSDWKDKLKPVVQQYDDFKDVLRLKEQFILWTDNFHSELSYKNYQDTPNFRQV